MLTKLQWTCCCVWLEYVALIGITFCRRRVIRPINCECAQSLKQKANRESCKPLQWYPIISNWDNQKKKKTGCVELHSLKRKKCKWGNNIKSILDYMGWPTNHWSLLILYCIFLIKNVCVLCVFRRQVSGHTRHSSDWSESTNLFCFTRMMKH